MADLTPEQIEQERVAFEARYKYLDLSKSHDAWDRPVYGKSHVDAIWAGWLARASQQAPTSTPETPTNYSEKYSATTPGDTSWLDELQVVAWLSAPVGKVPLVSLNDVRLMLDAASTAQTEGGQA